MAAPYEPLIKALQSFSSFTRMERIGLLAIVFVLVMLICVRISLIYWQPLPTKNTSEQQMLQAWAVFQRAQTMQHAKNTNARMTQPLPDVVNINTADSITLIGIVGIGPVTAHKILYWRQKNGRFQDMEMFKEVSQMHGKRFAAIAAFVTLDTNTAAEQSQ